MFAYKLAERFNRPNVYLMLDEMDPDELDNWAAYYQIMAEQRGPKMDTPEEFEASVTPAFQTDV